MLEVLKTTEIKEDLWPSIVEGYNDCFPSHKESVESLKERYYTNPIECYHAIYIEDDKVVAFNSIMPSHYFIDGEKRIVGLSSDTYILPDYRKNLMLFRQLYLALRKACEKDGVAAIVAVPNPNSHMYFIRVLKCHDVEDLNYWVLPIKIGNIIGRSRWLNIFSLFYSSIVLFINAVTSRLFNNFEEKRKSHVIVNNDYLDKRLSSKHYVNIAERSIRFTYTVTEDEGIRCAYIMYAGEGGIRSYNAIFRCVKYIYFHESVDMVMFNGTLNIRQILLTKVPKRFEPRRLPFIVDLLDTTQIEKKQYLLEKNNWDFTLLNLDVR